MNVPSYEFLAFAAVVALVINLSTSSRWRRAVLLPANIGFFLSFSLSPVYIAPFAAFLALGYIGMKLLERYKRRSLFVLLLGAVILVFCTLKQYTFIPARLFLPFPYLAVGLSYVFFRVAHLVIDAYQEALDEPIGIVSYLNYTLNFTCLVSGPIQLYQDYRRTESQQPAPLGRPEIGMALDRIVTGFFKVAVLSPVLAAAQAWSVSTFFAAAGGEQRVLDAVLVIIVFPVYLYINFSGYTDCVIGAARFLRLELPENFNHPFISEGFIEFWGRWHMTLSHWWKTYVYSPLFMALMRRFPSPRIQPLLGVAVYFVTFFFVGVWHGQTTMFLFLGVLLGLGVSVNKLYQIEMTKRLGRSRYRELCGNPWYSALSRGLTFSYFAFASLWFWSSWSQLGAFASLLGPAGLTVLAVIVLASATVSIAALKAVFAWLARVASGEAALLPPIYVRTAWYTAMIVLTLSITVVLNAPAPRIVYKAF
jgi:D-alanyl-lipoteichoic acid acyltransferase DltB (MBOAT superfamily)